MIPSTLCYIITEGKILLIKKKQGLGVGMYNGAGGKIEEGELPHIAAIRESMEETGVEPIDPMHVGTIAFYYGQEEKIDWLVHVFTATKFKGEPVNTEEADVEWFDIDKIPYDNMWKDDKVWMPLMLEGKKFLAKFWFNKECSEILKHDMVVVAE